MDTETKAATAAIANGSITGRRLLALYALIWVLMFFVAHIASQGIDPLFRVAWRSSVWGMLMFLSIAFVTACIPELRRLAIALLQAGTRPAAADVAITLFLMLTWGLGASRLLSHYPILLFDPKGEYDFLHLGVRIDGGPIHVLLATLNAAVFAPMAEELVFRGYLLNLWRVRYRLWTAIVMSSIAFGFWHFQWALFATVMGVFLALVYIRYRSLVLCMLLHGLYNLLVQRALLGQFFVHKDREAVTSLSSWSLELLLAALFIPLLFLFLKRFLPQSSSS